MPLARPCGLAVSSSSSATTSSCSSRSSTPRFCSADISTVIVSPPHASGTSPCSESCVQHPLGIGVVAVDLVDGHHDRHLGRLGVVDGLDRLRHHAVVGGHDQHDDVGHLRATGAHLGEGGVARRVDERDRLAALHGLVGADVLGDATGLAGHDVGRADAVEQQRLAVVDVAHDRDDRRPRLLGLGIVVVVVVEEGLQLELLLLAGLHEQHVGADLEREQLDLLVGERHGGGDHLAVLEEEAHDVGRGAVQLGAELLRRGAPLDDDGALGDGSIRRRVGRHRLGRQLLHGATTTATSLAGRPALRAARATGTTTRDGRDHQAGRQGLHRDRHRGHRRAAAEAAARATDAGAGPGGPPMPGRGRGAGTAGGDAPAPPGRPASGSRGAGTGATRARGRRDGLARERERAAGGRRDRLARGRHAAAPRRAHRVPPGRAAGAGGRAPATAARAGRARRRRDRAGAGGGGAAGRPCGRPARPGRRARTSCSTRAAARDDAMLGPRRRRPAAAGGECAAGATGSAARAAARGPSRPEPAARDRRGRAPRPATGTTGALDPGAPVQARSPRPARRLGRRRGSTAGGRLTSGAGAGLDARPAGAGARPRPAVAAAAFLVARCEPAWAAPRAGRRASGPRARPCGARGRPGPPRCSTSGSSRRSRARC